MTDEELNPSAARHDRGAEQDEDDGKQLAVNDSGDQPQFLGADHGHLPRRQRLAPRQKLHVGMIDNSPTTMKSENFAWKA